MNDDALLGGRYPEHVSPREFAHLVGAEVRTLSYLMRAGLPVVRFSGAAYLPLIPAVRWYCAHLRQDVRA